MSNGTFLKPNSASDLPWRFVMHDRWAIYLFLLFVNILCVHRHRSGFECDPAKNPQWISGIDNMRPNQILGRKGTEPRAQGSGKGSPPDAATWGPRVGWFSMRGVGLTFALTTCSSFIARDGLRGEL